MIQETQPDEIYNLGLEKKTRFYQASTSELYSLVQETNLPNPDLSQKHQLHYAPVQNKNANHPLPPPPTAFAPASATA